MLVVKQRVPKSRVAFCAITWTLVLAQELETIFGTALSREPSAAPQEVSNTAEDQVPHFMARPPHAPPTAELPFAAQAAAQSSGGSVDSSSLGWRSVQTIGPEWSRAAPGLPRDARAGGVPADACGVSGANDGFEAAMSELTHVDARGKASMVDVGLVRNPSTLLSLFLCFGH